MLDGRPAGERVTLTEIRTRTARHASTPRVAEVLAELDLLEDDAIPAIRSWIGRRAGELPDGFAGAVRAWLLLLLDGDARARPRSPASIYVYFGTVRPFIERWPAVRGHLREVTANDLEAVLDPLWGHQLRNAIATLRSLFRFAKKRGLVFANPATRLKTGDANRSLLPSRQPFPHIGRPDRPRDQRIHRLGVKKAVAFDHQGDRAAAIEQHQASRWVPLRQSRSRPAARLCRIWAPSALASFIVQEVPRRVATAGPCCREQTGLMRVVVTQVGWDGTMWRRMVDTAGRGDAGRWEELIARALAAPPPYRPVPGSPIYHLRVGDRQVLVAEHDLSGPLFDLVSAVLAVGEAP